MPDHGWRTAVVLDANALWLEAVERVLGGAEIAVVLKTSKAAEVLRALPGLQPGLLVMDIEGGGAGDGMELLSQAARLAPGMRILVLSANTDATAIYAALAAGAAGYVFKSAHPDDLATAVRQAFDHSIFLAHSLVTVDRPSAAARPTAGSEGILTKREYEILRLVAEGHSNAELARMLWITEQTVKFHLSNVYRKLSVSNRTEAARWAQVNGLLSGDQVVAA